MVAQSRSDVSEGDLRCTVNFEERQQILDVESRVLELEYNQEDCSIPSTSLTCNIQSHFALLQEMPALLRNDTSSPMEREGLADDLENVIPFFRDLLRDQLELEVSLGLGGDCALTLTVLYVNIKTGLLTCLTCITD